MDTQIWYAIFSTLFGGIYGAFRRLGEVCGYCSLLHKQLYIFSFLGFGKDYVMFELDNRVTLSLLRVRKKKVCSRYQKE